MINVATLVGRVGNKDTKQLKRGGDITIISVATSKKYKDSSGQSQEQTTWHNVNCFNKLSEIAQKYIHVGDLVFIQGEIQNKKVEKGEREGQYMYSLHANNIRVLSPKKSNRENTQEKDDSHEQDPMDDDEIPF